MAKPFKWCKASKTVPKHFNPVARTLSDQAFRPRRTKTLIQAKRQSDHWDRAGKRKPNYLDGGSAFLLRFNPLNSLF